MNFRWGIHYAWKHHGAVIEGAAGMTIAAGEPFYSIGFHWIPFHWIPLVNNSIFIAVRKLAAVLQDKVSQLLKLNFQILNLRSLTLSPKILNLRMLRVIKFYDRWSVLCYVGGTLIWSFTKKLSTKSTLISNYRAWNEDL